MSTAGDEIDVGDGITLPRKVVSTRYTRGFRVYLEATYDPETGRYRARRIDVEADDDQEVTGEMLRQVAVKPLLRLATESAVVPYLDRLPNEVAKAGPTDETLHQVAVIYKLALLLGDAPTATVADRLDIARSTAGGWVTRARDRGLLTVTDPRGRKG